MSVDKKEWADWEARLLAKKARKNEEDQRKKEDKEERESQPGGKKRPKKLPKARMAINAAKTASIAEKYRTRDPHYLDEKYGDLVG